MQGILLTQDDGALLGPIAKILGVIMDIIFNFLDLIGIPNIGLSIILFTIVVYLLMLPMTIKQQKFSKLSAKMQPELQKITKKYEGKKDQASMMKQQEETRAVYDKDGVSPTGSCLQLLIQMPILFALYRVIYAIPAYVGKIKDVYIPLVNKLIGVEGVDEILKGFKNSVRYVNQFSNESFTGGVTEYIQNTYIDCLNMASSTEWASLAEAFPSLANDINNTYAQISKYNNFLGLNIGNTPMDIIKEGVAIGAYGLVVAAVMIPVLAAVTQWLNVKLMPNANDTKKKSGNETADTMASSMKTMNNIMPLMSAWFCFSFPSGMGIYWIAGAVVRGVQQVAVNKYIDRMDFDAVIESNKEKAAEKAKKRRAKNEKILAQTEALNQVANQNTKKISSKATFAEAYKMSLEEREAKMKEIEKYSKSSQKSSKGSIAAKANMVKNYNDGK